LQKIKLYITLFVIGLIASGLGLIIIVFSFSPESWLGLILFYLFCSLFAFSAFVLIGVYARRLFGRRELVHDYFFVALRQGFGLSIILLLSLILASLGLFSWANALFLLLAMIFFEFYLSSRNKM